MTIATMLSLGETALKLGLICSLTVLALFLSYSMLNVCDLSTDGCFTSVSYTHLIGKLHEIAKYLYEHETITGEEFMKILNEAPVEIENTQEN